MDRVGRMTQIWQSKGRTHDKGKRRNYESLIARGSAGEIPIPVPFKPRLGKYNNNGYHTFGRVCWSPLITSSIAFLLTWIFLF